MFIIDAQQNLVSPKTVRSFTIMFKPVNKTIVTRQASLPKGALKI